MASLQMVCLLMWKKIADCRKSPTAVLAAFLHGATAAFWLLPTDSRTVEHGVGTVVLSGMGSVQHVSALVATVIAADSGWWLGVSERTRALILKAGVSSTERRHQNIS